MKFIILASLAISAAFGALVNSPFVSVSTDYGSVVRNLATNMTAGGAVVMGNCVPYTGTRHEAAVAVTDGGTDSSWVIDRVAAFAISSDVPRIGGISIWLAAYSDTGTVGSHADGYADPGSESATSIQLASNASVVATTDDALEMFATRNASSSLVDRIVSSVFVSGPIGIAAPRWLGLRLLDCAPTTTEISIPWVKIAGVGAPTPFRQRAAWTGSGPDVQWNDEWTPRAATMPNGLFFVVFVERAQASSPASSPIASPSIIFPTESLPNVAGSSGSDPIHRSPSDGRTTEGSSSSRKLAVGRTRGTGTYIAIGCAAGGAIGIAAIVAIAVVAIRRRRRGSLATGAGESPAGDLGSTAIAMASSAASPDARPPSEKVTVSTQGIAAAEEPLAVCKGFSALASVFPEVIAVPAQVQVLSRDPGVATFRLGNSTDCDLQYRIDASIAGTAFDVTVGEIRTADDGVPVPSAELCASVFAARDSIKGDLVATGTIGARGSATFAAFVLARVSTSKRPRIGLAVGTQRPAERSASFRRRRRSSNSLDDSAAYSPEFAVHAFEVMVAVGPHALVDPDEVQLVREVGRGAFGVVYSANWRSQVVAVKELACAEGGINSDDVRRELNNLSDLRNQYVVQFYGFTVVRNRIQIITEFFRLGSLEGMLRSAVSRFDEAIPLGLRTRFACDSARGMSYLAGMSVVHRDFKPGNLLVVHTRPEEPSPCCKLTDFGSARSSAVGAEGITSMTKGVGTPIFMAPEILAGGRGVSYTQKTDVFAYGVSLYHIFSGKEPYDGFETMTQVINFVTGGKRLDLAPIAEVTKRSSDGFSELGGVGSAISDLISACWTHEQGSRPTFDDVVSIIAPISEIVVTETTRGNRRIRDLDHPT